MYKVSIILPWKVENDNISKDFYKEGLLFFAEYNGTLLENSTTFIQGFPMVNTLKHEFLIEDKDIKLLRFFIKVNYFEGAIIGLKNSNLIQIEKL